MERHYKPKRSEPKDVMCKGNLFCSWVRRAKNQIIRIVKRLENREKDPKSCKARNVKEYKEYPECWNKRLSLEVMDPLFEVSLVYQKAK